MPTPHPDRPIPSLPDLVVHITSIDRTTIVYGAQPWSWIHYQVTNIGTKVVPAGVVRLRALVNGAMSSGYMAIDEEIPVGATVASRFAVGHDSVWPVGEYKVQMVVDEPNRIRESNEYNNRSNVIQFRVVSSDPRPDLVVKITSIDHTTIVFRQQPWTWVHYEVSNVGTASTPAGQIYLRAWVNGSPSSGYMTVPGPLAPGASVASKFAVGHDNGWPPGDFRLHIEVDYRQILGESREDNNRSQEITFRVVPAADQSPPALEWTVTNSQTGARQVFVGTGQLRVHASEVYQVELTARDPEGLTRMTLGGEAEWTCSSGGFSSRSSSLEQEDVRSFTAGASGSYPASSVISRTVDLHTFRCQSGYSFDGGRKVLSGAANNVAGLLASGRLTFNVIP